MRKAWMASLVGVAAMAATAAVAVAATTSVLTQSFSTKKHGKSATTTFRLVSTNSAGGLPAPSSLDVNYLPAGTKYSTKGFKFCDTNALKATGPSACPAGSQVGSGSSTLGAQVGTISISEHADVLAFLGGPNTLLLYAHGSTPIPQTLVLVGSVAKTSGKFGIKITVPIPDIPTVAGAPNASITDFGVSVGKGKLLTTPKTCKGHKWTFQNVATYKDGSVSKTTATQKC